MPHESPWATRDCVPTRVVLCSHPRVACSFKEPALYRSLYPRLRTMTIDMPSGQTNGTTAPEEVRQYDVVVVGAGFSGISTLHRLRKHGLKAHIFESG